MRARRPRAREFRAAKQAMREYRGELRRLIRIAEKNLSYTQDKIRLVQICIDERTKKAPLTFGENVPPHFDEQGPHTKKKKKHYVGRTTSCVRRRIRAFTTNDNLVSRDGRRPPANADEKYIRGALKGVPRVHIPQKFTPHERDCLLKAIKLRAQMKLTQSACQDFTTSTKKDDSGVRNASEAYSAAYKNIKNITTKMINDCLGDDDWPYIAQLLFCQLEPDRAKMPNQKPKKTAMDCKIFWCNEENSFKGPWTEAEEKKFQVICTKYNGCHWEKIAKETGTGRSIKDYLNHYQLKYNKKFKRSAPWTKEEDEKLEEAIRETGDIDFLSAAKAMEGRNQMQCFLRWRNTLRPGIKFGEKFSVDEDIALYLAVLSRGPAWKMLTPHIDDIGYHGRTDLATRERFTNFMDPKLFFKEFSKEEETKLRKIIETDYPKSIDGGKKFAIKPEEWPVIAGKMSTPKNTKTAYMVKRTWMSMQRRKRSVVRRQELKKAKGPKKASRKKKRGGTAKKASRAKKKKAATPAKATPKKRRTRAEAKAAARPRKKRKVKILQVNQEPETTPPPPGEPPDKGKPARGKPRRKAKKKTAPKAKKKAKPKSKLKALKKQFAKKNAQHGHKPSPSPAKEPPTPKAPDPNGRKNGPLAHTEPLLVRRTCRT